MITVVLAALLLTLHVSAIEFHVEKPVDLGIEIFNYTGDKANMTGYNTNAENGGKITNINSGTHFGPKFDAYVWYEFTAPSDGIYTFCLDYYANPNANRGIDYSIDDPDGTKRVFVDLQEAAAIQYVTGTIELTAGVHQFYIYAPTGMDDKDLLTCDIHNVALYFTAATESTVDVSFSYPGGIAQGDVAAVWLDGVDVTADVSYNPTGFTLPVSDTTTAATVQRVSSSEHNYVYFVKNDGGTLVATFMNDLTDLLPYVGTAIRTNAILGQGLRFKSSMPQSIKTSGTAGYTVSEYGTLAKIGWNSGLPFGQINDCRIWQRESLKLLCWL